MSDNIDNTTKMVRDNPLAALLLAAAVGTSGMIEAQEAAGQRQLVVSSVLPTDGLEKEREVLEAWGVVIGEPVPGDEMFTSVTLPAGWQKKATGHSMHSDLLDDRGHRRAGMFYKAAFYDRSAHISLCSRLTYGRDYEKDDETFGFVATSDGVRIWTTQVVAYGKRPGNDAPTEVVTAYYKTKDAVEKGLYNRATAFLNEYYPDWESKTAYWDMNAANEEGTE